MRANAVTILVCGAVAVAAARAEETAWPAVAPTSFELLGQARIPAGADASGAPVGGLSGLAWDAAHGDLLAISDDRSERAPARVVRLSVRFDGGRLTDGGAAATASFPLHGRDGQPFPVRSLDPEGIALAGGSLFVSSEGEAKSDVAPFVDEFDLEGRFLRELPRPERFVPRTGADGRRRGIRDNLAFESLALSPDGRFLFAGAENALEQESAAAAPGVPSLSRILRWELGAPGGEVAAPREILYRVEGVNITPPKPTDFLVNGLVELVALDGENLLALERQYVPGAGLSIRLYAVALAGAADVTDVEPVGAQLPAAKKTLLFDFKDLGVDLDNYEGVAFGPPLADGRRTLFVVSDDNFNADLQKTLLLAFAVGFDRLGIANVQGASHRSPLAGRFVAGIEGVVTAIEDTKKSRGFWLESDRPDTDPATSEGIFVDWEGASTLAVGDRVRVGGRVEERDFPKSLPVTVLKLVSLDPLAKNASLPAPPRIGRDRLVPERNAGDAFESFDPVGDALDFWESLESMRVEVPGGTVVGPLRSFGEFVLLPDGAEAGAKSAKGGIFFTEQGGSDLDRVVVGRRIAGKAPEVQVGDRIDGPFVGIVDYGYSIYKVQALAPLTAATSACGESTALRDGKGSVTLATLNVENLSVAGGVERMPAFGRVIVEELGSPAILALEEIQDDSGTADNGVVTSRATLDAFREAIASAGGPLYDAIWIDPENGRDGGQPGGNIRSVLLYDSRRAELVRRGIAGAADSTAVTGKGGKAALTLSPGRIAATSPAFDIRSGEGVRKSLAAEFLVGKTTLFVVANHLSSKWDDDRAFGSRQPALSPTAAKRLAQTAELRKFAESLIAADPKARLVLLGDLNEPEWAEGVAGLSRPPLLNLTTRLPANDRYTFNFEGSSQAIDHVVVSPALAAGAEVDIVHRNSDCPDSLRVSDHDPVVVRLALK